ncbi:APC family permease, partial [Lentilactobacillus hilgardii]
MDSKNTPKINLFQLVMLALGSLIGSGWLFGSWEASRIAGPASIISWIIGGLVIGAVAYDYVEIGAMFPEAGGMSKYAQYSHGPLLGFIAAWANWTHQFLKNGTITNSGLLVVFGFILIFTLLNYWSVRVLTGFTSLISIFKIGVPTLTIVMLTISGFHPQNYGQSWHDFMPYGTAPVFAATSVAGIIFSFNAFQTVIRSCPRSMIFDILLCK